MPLRLCCAAVIHTRRVSVGWLLRLRPPGGGLPAVCMRARSPAVRGEGQRKKRAITSWLDERDTRSQPTNQFSQLTRQPANAPASQTASISLPSLSFEALTGHITRIHSQPLIVQILPLPHPPYSFPLLSFLIPHTTFCTSALSLLSSHVLTSPDSPLSFQSSCPILVLVQKFSTRLSAFAILHIPLASRPFSRLSWSPTAYKRLYSFLRKHSSLSRPHLYPARPSKVNDDPQPWRPLISSERSSRSSPSLISDTRAYLPQSTQSRLPLHSKMVCTTFLRPFCVSPSQLPSDPALGCLS